MEKMTNIVFFLVFIRISCLPRMFLIILKQCNHVVENVPYDVNTVKTKINILTSSSRSLGSEKDHLRQVQVVYCCGDQEQTRQHCQKTTSRKILGRIVDN
jgi:hypothetical protein